MPFLARSLSANCLRGSSSLLGPYRYRRQMLIIASFPFHTQLCRALHLCMQAFPSLHEATRSQSRQLIKSDHRTCCMQDDTTLTKRWQKMIFAAFLVLQHTFGAMLAAVNHCTTVGGDNSEVSL